MINPIKKDVTIGDCRLILGDCLEVMPILGGGFSMLADPPYGTENLGGGYGRRQNHTLDGVHGRRIKNDADLSALASLLPQIKMENGYIIIFAHARKTQEIVKALGDETIAHKVVWNKKQMGLGYTVRYAHEDILILQRGEPDRPPFALPSVLTAHQSEKLHPHQKPIVVMKTLASWLPGEILDPFMGSGTTGVACAHLGRKFTGIEIDPEYFEIACKRISDAYAPTDGLFAPSVKQEALL